MYLTIAFKDRFQEVVKKMGCDIWFLFQNDKKFETGCVEFPQKYPKIKDDFLKMIRDDRFSWLNLMISVRNNAIDHSAGQDKNLVKSLEAKMTLEIVELIFDNCWRAIEDCMYFLAVSNVDPKYGMFIWELQEYKQNRNSPHRFVWDIKSNKIKLWENT